jgi:hypothetical protein
LKNEKRHEFWATLFAASSVAYCEALVASVPPPFGVLLVPIEWSQKPGLNGVVNGTGAVGAVNVIPGEKLVPAPGS